MKTLDCAAPRAELVAFLDGELRGETLDALERHLGGCADCVAVRDSLDQVWTALDHLPGLEPRAGWLAEVERAVIASDSPKEGLVVAFPLRRLLVTFAVAAALAFAAGLVFLSSQPAAPGDSELLVTAPAPPAPDGTPAELPPPEPTESPDAAPDEWIPQPDGSPDTAVADASESVDTADTDDPELRGLSDAELEMIAELEVLVLLDELDELDVLEALEFLDDLDEDELTDET